MRIRNNQGSIIFPMIVALTLAIFSISYYYYNALMIRKIEDQKLLMVFNLKAYVASSKALIVSPHAFFQSAKLTANGDFLKCLNDPEFNCPQTTEADFYLNNEDGTLFMDMTTGVGFTPTMDSCINYPSLACPFRYELKWFAECVVGSGCYSPDLFIRGELKVAKLGGIRNLINPENFKILIKIR